MVQGIATVTNYDVTDFSWKNTTRSEDIKNAFVSALNQASGSQSAGGSNSSEETNEKLMSEFKKLSQGLTVCGKCGTMYRGTAVSRCSKCGNDMTEDAAKAAKMQDGSASAGISSATSLADAGLAASVKKK